MKPSIDEIMEETVPMHTICETCKVVMQFQDLGHEPPPLQCPKCKHWGLGPGCSVCDGRVHHHQPQVYWAMLDMMREME